MERELISNFLISLGRNKKEVYVMLNKLIQKIKTIKSDKTNIKIQILTEKLIESNNKINNLEQQL